MIPTRRIDDIISNYQSYSQDDPAILRKAYVFIAGKLQELSPEKSSRELSLALETAYIITDLHLDFQSVIGALFTSCLKGSRPTLRTDINQIFGQENATVFDTLCQVFDRFDANLENVSITRNIEILIRAAHANVRVIFIILAKRLADLRFLSETSSEKESILFARETLDIYTLIAHRLGFERLKVELENLSFAVLEPQKYEETKKFVSGIKERQDQFFTEFDANVKQILHQEHISYHFSYRVKHLYSLYKKSVLKKKPYSELYDISACRIIVSSADECYKILGLLNKKYRPLRGRYKDYIAAPKLNGYQSLHSTLMADNGFVFEVQIRTEQMHLIAEYGFAAHWIYKEKSKTKNSETQGNEIIWLRELNQSLGMASTPEEALEIFRRELYQDSVYVFTPQGKIITLPMGATVIDFAYAIHTEIGHHCAGAKINGVAEPVETILDSGDRVEVLTHQKVLPHSDWLNISLTNKARQNIRQKIKELSIKNAEKLGEKLFEDLLRKFKQDQVSFLQRQEVQEYFKENGFSVVIDYYRAIGFNQVDPSELMGRLALSPKIYEGIKKKFYATFNRKDKNARIQGIENLPTRIARCCSPLQYDKVVGLVVKSGQIVIHEEKCSKVQGLEKTVGNIIELTWENELPERKPLDIIFRYPNNFKNLNKINRFLQKNKAVLVGASLKVSGGQAEYRAQLHLPENVDLRIFLNKGTGIEGVFMKKHK